MQPMNKIQQQTLVLPVEVLDAETALLFRQQQHFVPSN
jgi:hypothetical protein